MIEESAIENAIKIKRVFGSNARVINVNRSYILWERTFGATYKDIANALNVSRQSLVYWVRKWNGIKPDRKPKIPADYVLTKGYIAANKALDLTVNN